MGDELSLLRARLEELAEENRRSARQVLAVKRLGFAMVAVLSILLVAGRQPVDGPASIDAEQIRIVGKDGKPRAIIGVKDGVVAILMKDMQGNDRIGFAVYGDGTSGLAFVDSAGVQRLGLALANGKPAITVRDIRGRDCLGFGMTEDAVGMNILKYIDKPATNMFLGIEGGTARLSVGELDDMQLKAFIEKRHAPRPKHSLRLGVSDRGGPFLQLLDRKGEERLQLSVSDIGTSSLEMRDASQTPRVGLSTTNQGEPRIFLREENQFFLLPVPKTGGRNRDKGT